MKKLFFATAMTASPATCRAMLRALAAYGPMSEIELSQLLRPSGLIEEKDEWPNSLRVLEDIALINRADDFVSISEGLPEGISGDDPCDFRIAVRTALLHQARSSIYEGGDPGDLAQGLFWLSLVPHEALWANGDDRRLVESLTSLGFREAIVNNTQWGIFARWARALGFMLPGSRNSPDFSCALRDVLPAAKQSSNFSELLQHLNLSIPGAHDPVLREWYRKLRPEVQIADVGPVLSWALYRLQHEGQVSLLHRDDAPGAIKCSRPLGLVSHVEVSIT